MNSFASKGDTQHKLRFAFNIYDIGRRSAARTRARRDPWQIFSQALGVDEADSDCLPASR